MNPAFVLDASFTLAWFTDEGSPSADRALATLNRSSALVPALWAFEVASALQTAERRGRIDRHQIADYLERLRNLPIAIEHRPSTWLCQQILAVARVHRLTALDAAYLELAQRERLSLATLDTDLRTAALACGVPLIDFEDRDRVDPPPSLM